MDRSTRNHIAEALEALAAQPAWDEQLWQQCFELVRAYWDNELLAYVHHDLIHYSGLWHSVNILGFRTNPNPYALEEYREEFLAIASALRDDITLEEVKAKYGW
jgi:hypothetical protein